MSWDPEASIVGIGESEYHSWGGAEKSEFGLACEAILEAVADAGLDIEDIDGFSTYMSQRVTPDALATSLGIPVLRFGSLGWGGGNSTAFPVMSAAQAVHAGAAEYVVAFRSIAQGEHGRYGQPGIYQTENSEPDMNRVGGEEAHVQPYGLEVPPQMLALRAQRYMYEYDVPEEHLGHVALSGRYHANRNPRAVMYDRELTMDDYLNARMISDPYRLYDCCLEVDGACAVVVTTTDNARELDQPPVEIAAATQAAYPHWGRGMSNGMPIEDYTTGQTQELAERLYGQLGIGPEDIDVAQIYDHFSGQVLQGVEDFGFAPRGEAGQLFAAGETRGPDGDIPINTAGGNLSEAYIQGFELVAEAARQVRGTSTTQVEDVEHSLVLGPPGTRLIMPSLILSGA